jgi:hypothetical protein
LATSYIPFSFSLPPTNPTQFSHAIKARQPCFISSPEWQCLFSPTPTYPYHTSQPRSLTLRTQRWTTLSELPVLFLEFSSLTLSSPTSPPGFISNRDSELDSLIQKAERLFTVIQTWVEGESETLRPDAYPDVIAAVLDCNASMALLTLTKMLASLQRARSRSPSSSPEAEGSRLYHPPSSWREDPVVIEYWRQRAIAAFEHVRQESMIACKVLEFGMEQLRLLGDKSEESEISGDCEAPRT